MEAVQKAVGKAVRKVVGRGKEGAKAKVKAAQAGTAPRPMEARWRPPWQVLPLCRPPCAKCSGFSYRSVTQRICSGSRPTSNPP